MDDFGPYEMVAEVAVGSTATVFKARHRQIDRIAAVKVLSPELRAAPRFLDRFRAEARVLSGLDHEHIVRIYDFVEEPTRSWIAEEWVDGVTIRSLLSDAGSLTAEQSLGVLRGALLGLAYAHDRGIVHGDLAPSNIIADLSGTSKLIDFGVSAPAGSVGVRGTPEYMSPEAVSGQPVGKTGDVYSAGPVLFTLLTGRRLFPAPTVDRVLDAHVAKTPPALSGHGSAMAALVADSLKKDPAARPADARAFLERMEEAAREHYGADWLARASIATAVLATGASAAVVAAAGSGQTGIAQSLTRPAEVAISTGKAATRLGRFSRRQLVAISGSLAGVLVVGGVAIALSTGNNGGTNIAGKPNVIATSIPPAPTTPTSTTTIASPALPLAQSIPTGGKYRLVSRVTSTNFPNTKVGPQPVRIWTFARSCSKSVCKSVIHSSSGAKFLSTFNGKSFVLTSRAVETGPCQYTSGPKKGQPTGDHGTSILSAHLHLSVVRQASGPNPARGTAVLLTGEGTVTEPRGTVTGTCVNLLKSYRETYSYTLKYVSS